MQSNFIEIALQSGCSPVNLLPIFRPPFPRKTSWLLLLNVFITKKFTQCKTSCPLMYLMYSKYQIIKILSNCFRSINCSSWIKLIPVLIHLKYWYYHSPYLELPFLPHHFCLVFKLANWKSLTQPSSYFSSVSLFSPNPFDHMPSQVLDITNYMPSQTNQIYYQAISRS